MLLITKPQFWIYIFLFETAVSYDVYDAVFFPRGVLDEILNLIESVSEGFSFLLLFHPQFMISAMTLILT